LLRYTKDNSMKEIKESIMKSSFDIDKNLYKRFINLTNKKMLKRTRLIVHLIEQWIKENEKMR